MARTNHSPDPDDMFADTRMTFGEHIEDLRTHLLRAIYGFVLGFLIAIPIGRPVLNFISAPVEDQLNKFNDRYDRWKERSEAMQARIILSIVVDPTAPLGSKVKHAIVAGISATPAMITSAMAPFPNRCCQ